MENLVSIAIPNWEKYNARADRSNYSWFRFQNDFFQDHGVFGLSDSEIITYQMIICEASRKNKSEVMINLDLFASLRKTTAKKVSDQINSLVQRQLLLVSDSHLSVSAGRPTDIHTNITNKQTNTYVGRVPDLWASLVPSLPKIQDMNAQRKKRVHDFLGTKSESDLEDLFRRIEASDFLCGRATEFRASFDWVFKPANLTKILEGNYDNRKTPEELHLESLMGKPEEVAS